MKFTPRALADNVNVSRTHPLAELAGLGGGLLFLLAAIYGVFWLAGELLAPRVPIEVEVWAGRHLLGQVPHSPSPPLQRRLDALRSLLPKDSPLHRYPLSVSVVADEQINAVALPGGRILVFSGLLEELRSENELTFVLAHELGHYAHRDHLRGMGRGIGVSLALATLFGPDSRAAGFAARFCSGLEMRYSQGQEAAADTFGLHLLNALYGHAGGATDFFARLAAKAGNRSAYLLASHPHPEDRIDNLRRQINAAGCRVTATLPLQEDLLQTGDCAASGAH